MNAQTERGLTFRDFFQHVLKIRSALWQLGMRKGDVLLVLSPNAIEIPIINYATLSIGGILTACNPEYTKGKERSFFSLELWIK